MEHEIALQLTTRGHCLITVTFNTLGNYSIRRQLTNITCTDRYRLFSVRFNFRVRASLKKQFAVAMLRK